MMNTTHKIFSLAAVMFFIIGFAWAENNEEMTPEESIVNFLQEEARALDDTGDLDELIAMAADKRLALLGEASHGTTEYYSWRKNISRRLIEEKGYSFIVVEGDWPASFAVNRYVKGKDDIDDIPSLLVDNFQRWPQWMWANEDVLALVEWLRGYNEGLPFEERVGFYGMDVYSFEESIEEVKTYIRQTEDEVLMELKKHYRAFAPYNYDGFAYARAVYLQGVELHEGVGKVKDALLERADELREKDEFEYFNALQNGLIVKNAEEYYRLAVTGGPAGWNSRVRHMEETVYRLLDHYGPQSKGIVWAHNTHVGDARATAMTDQQQVNIGELARQELGEENVFIVGFSTYTGTVMAGRQWGASREVMEVPEAMNGSIDNLLEQVGKESYWLTFTDEARAHRELSQRRGQRAIGVVYNPERERMGNYVPTSLPHRYDALLFFRETRSLEPLY